MRRAHYHQIQAAAQVVTCLGPDLYFAAAVHALQDPEPCTDSLHMAMATLMTAMGMVPMWVALQLA